MTDDNCICAEINARHCPVHNEEKPREWWIDSIEHSGRYASPSGRFTAYEKPKSALDPVGRRQIHVIEYSAYLKEKERADRLQKGFWGWCDMDHMPYMSKAR